MPSSPGDVDRQRQVLVYFQSSGYSPDLRFDRLVEFTMDKEIPVHLICGFLGAGKTTLMRHVLAMQPSDERLVIVINEYGELGIDGRLLEGFDSDVRELTTGCICCTLQSDLVYALFDVYEQFLPDRIIIEASGVAEVEGLQKAVSRVGLTTPLRLGSITTVVDAEMFRQRDMLGKAFLNPIRKADLILLNKVDLIGEDEVAFHCRALNEINSEARLVPVLHCAVDRELFLAPGRAVFPIEDSDGHHQHLEEEGFVAFSFESPAPLDKVALRRWLDGLPWEVFRVKGFVCLEEGRQVLNYTYRHPEFTHAEGEGGTQLAFVGWNVDQEKILAGLRACHDQ